MNNGILHDSGISYCLEHAGTRNEDEDGPCNWHDREAWVIHKQPCRLVPLVFEDDADVEVVDGERTLH